MKRHGIGVGYRYPHDYEGADVDQQYLPDELADRRYYLPTDQGYEAHDREPDDRPRRGPGRKAAEDRGATPTRKPTLTKGDGDIMRTRETNRKKLAETEKQDAGEGN